MIDYLHIITHFRETVFNAANSGLFGNYSDELDEFNEEVEEGFSDNGTEWLSKDGSLRLSCQNLIEQLNQGVDQKTLERLEKEQDKFNEWPNPTSKSEFAKYLKDHLDA